MANEILFLAVRGSEIPNDDVRVGALRSGSRWVAGTVDDAGWASVMRVRCEGGVGCSRRVGVWSSGSDGWVAELGG